MTTTIITTPADFKINTLAAITGSFYGIIRYILDQEDPIETFLISPISMIYFSIGYCIVYGVILEFLKDFFHWIFVCFIYIVICIIGIYQFQFQVQVWINQ